MDWLFQILPFAVFAFVVISIIRSAAKVARKLGEQPTTPRTPATYDPGEAARTRRIQEEIRRKIAERRGVTLPAESAPRPEPVVETRRIPVSVAVEPSVMASTAAVLERQQELADQMRALEVARASAQRKAAALAATAQEETQQAAVTKVTRGALLDDLRSSSTARRAIILREILDRPVALR